MNAVITTDTAPSFASTVWRLVRFDLRRFRWLAVLIVAAEIARAPSWSGPCTSSHR